MATPAEEAVRELDKLRDLQSQVDMWMVRYRLRTSLFAVQTTSLKWAPATFHSEEEARLPDAIAAEFYTFLGERSHAIADQIRALEVRLESLQELR